MIRLSFDDIFIEFAFLLSKRSTCSRARVGCIVTSFNNDSILSMGYNGNYRGGPNKCDSDELGNCGCLHAEDNCLIKMNFNDASRKKMYTTTSPCIICAKRIINAGINEVIYFNEYRKSDGIDLLTSSNICVRKYDY